MIDELVELPEEPAERVEVMLEEILDALDLDGEIVVDERDDEIVARIEGDELGLLIGRRGQTIDAVQPAIASAGARRSSARPSAPRSGRWRAARRSSSSR